MIKELIIAESLPRGILLALVAILNFYLALRVSLLVLILFPSLPGGILHEFTCVEENIDQQKEGIPQPSAGKHSIEVQVKVLTDAVDNWKCRCEQNMKITRNVINIKITENVINL